MINRDQKKPFVGQGDTRKVSRLSVEAADLKSGISSQGEQGCIGSNDILRPVRTCRA